MAFLALPWHLHDSAKARSAPFPSQAPEKVQSIWRHISLSPDLQVAIRLPADVVEQNATWAHDPFPPLQSATSQYDETQVEYRRDDTDDDAFTETEEEEDEQGHRQDDDDEEEEDVSLLRSLMQYMPRFF